MNQWRPGNSKSRQPPGHRIPNMKKTNRRASIRPVLKVVSGQPKTMQVSKEKHLIALHEGRQWKGQKKKKKQGHKGRRRGEIMDEGFECDKDGWREKIRAKGRRPPPLIASEQITPSASSMLKRLWLCCRQITRSGGYCSLYACRSGRPVSTSKKSKKKHRIEE